MTPEQIAAVLDRVYLATVRVHKVVTDGMTFYPHREVEALAAELGHARHPSGPGSAGFTEDPDLAGFHRECRLRKALRVAVKAGAPAEDVEALREALGVPDDNPILAKCADDIDAGNERTVRVWAEQAEAERRKELGEAFEAGRLAGLGGQHQRELTLLLNRFEELSTMPEGGELVDELLRREVCRNRVGTRLGELLLEVRRAEASQGADAG